MPNQDDLIRENERFMAERAAARRRGEVPGRVVELTRAKANQRIRILQDELDKLRNVPNDATVLRAELASVRSAHTALLSERDALLSDRDKLASDLATLRASIVTPE